MLARRLPTTLPKMSLDEALETTKIHSVAGTPAARRVARGAAAISGTAPHDLGRRVDWGRVVSAAGEVSLAHGGVLFLDELPEFRKNVLEVLRQRWRTESSRSRGRR